MILSVHEHFELQVVLNQYYTTYCIILKNIYTNRHLVNNDNSGHPNFEFCNGTIII